MFALIFSILWTVVSTVLIATNLHAVQGWQVMVALAFPLFGLAAVQSSWRHWRRRRSLRTEVTGGVTHHVWIGLDGRECRATRDPREAWDSDGAGDGARDGAGDGGGGD